MSGNTSHLENIPIVPLYFAAPRPVVRRDGALIMVDDERMRLEPGENARNARRCASARSAAIRSPAPSRASADTLAGIIQEMLVATTSERQGRVIDHDQSRLDGEEKAGGLFLMPPPATSSLLRRKVLSLHHLRQRR